MHPRTIQGKKVYVGDIVTTPGTTDSRFRGKITKIDKSEGLVQFEGDSYHWYSTENRRHVYKDEK